MDIQYIQKKSVKEIQNKSNKMTVIYLYFESEKQNMNEKILR